MEITRVPRGMFAKFRRFKVACRILLEVLTWRLQGKYCLISLMFGASFQTVCELLECVGVEA